MSTPKLTFWFIKIGEERMILKFSFIFPLCNLIFIIRFEF